MKEKSRQKRRFSLSGLLFAVLFFSSLLSVYTAAKYVLTRHVAFAVAVDKSLLQGYVEEGLVWDLYEGNTGLACNNEGYTITLMADGTEGTLSGSGLETNMNADTLSHRTGYVTAEGTAVETVVSCSAFADSGHSLTASIVANTEKGEIHTYIDNRLVQIYTLDETMIPELSALAEFFGQNLHSAKIYNRILTQAELSQNYYMDLLNYGNYEAQELPKFIQKDSLLRIESLYDWEDAGVRCATKSEAEPLSREDSLYRGIRVATASEASLNYVFTSDPDDKTERGYTMRYIVSVNSGGIANELFTSGGENPGIEAGIEDMDFVYRFAGKTGSVFCGNEGKTVIDLTVNEQGELFVYKNTECVDTFSDAEAGLFSFDQFSIRPSIQMETEGELGGLYKVEVYDRVLSPVELQYLYLRDEEAYHLGFREPFLFEVIPPEEELAEGGWITLEAGDLITWPEEEDCEFSHWFCKEYNVELYDEDLPALLDAMEADGFHRLHLQPVYILIEEESKATPSDAGVKIEETSNTEEIPNAEETIPEETGSTAAENKPEETMPVESKPAESEPETSKPTESLPESQPPESLPAESIPPESVTEDESAESIPEESETESSQASGGESTEAVVPESTEAPENAESLEVVKEETVESIMVS